MREKYPPQPSAAILDFAPQAKKSATEAKPPPTALSRARWIVEALAALEDGIVDKGVGGVVTTRQLRMIRDRAALLVLTLEEK